MERPFLLAEQPHQDPNSVPTHSRQARSSAFHADSCRARPVYPRTHRRWRGPLSPTMLLCTSYCERSMCRIGNGHTAEVAAARWLRASGFGRSARVPAHDLAKCQYLHFARFLTFAADARQNRRTLASGTQQSSAHPYRGKNHACAASGCSFILRMDICALHRRSYRSHSSCTVLQWRAK